MFRVGVSIVVLAGSVAAMPLVRSNVDAQSPKVTIKGSITYESDEALPPDSRAIVELRHFPALPMAPAVVGQRIDLEGKQAPVSFELTVERFRLTGTATYVVRAVILSGTRAIRTSDDVKVDVGAADVDAGTLTLKPLKAGLDPGR